MEDAARVLDAAVAQAPDPRLRARAEVERELVRLETEPGAGTEEARRVAEGALALLAGDALGQCRVWQLRGQLAWDLGRVATADAAWEQALRERRRAARAVRGRRLARPGGRARARRLWTRRSAAATGSARRWRRARSRWPRRSTRSPCCTRCAARSTRPTACSPRPASCWRSSAGSARASPTSRRPCGCWPGARSSPRRRCAPTPRRSRRWARAARWRPPRRCSRRPSTPRAAWTRRASCAARRSAVRRPTTRSRRRSGAASRPGSLAREGRHDDAEALARAAVALVEPTDLLSHRGDAMLDLADVLRQRGRIGEAERSVRAGLACYERKGNAAAAVRARAQLG